MKKPSTHRQKFPILKNVEFIDIHKDKQTVLSLKTNDVEGFTWRDLQTLLGEKIGPGRVNYTLKFLNSPELHRGLMTPAAIIGSNVTESLQIASLKNQLDNIQSKLNTQKFDVQTDILIQTIKTSYDSQINLLNIQLQGKDRDIQKLENQINDLETELDAAEGIIDDLKSQTGLNQYLGLIDKFLSAKSGKGKEIASLKESDTSDIPPEILQIIGMVDFKLIGPEQLQQIIHYLKVFIQELPLKQSRGQHGTSQN